MSFDLQIRERISLYLAGSIDAAALESWLSGVTWELDHEHPATRQSAFDALRLLSEAANGDWTPSQLRDQLQALSKIVTDRTNSVLPSVAAMGGEELLSKLSKAQQGAEQRHADAYEEAPAFALMGYAYLATQTHRSSESGQPSDPAFRRQPKVESDTHAPVEEELAIS
jgi:hypothetical protein